MAESNWLSFYWDGTCHNPTGCIILLGWHVSQSNWLYHFIGMARFTIQLAVSFYWDGTCHNPTGCIILLGWHVSQSNWLYYFIGMTRVTIQLAVSFYWDGTCYNPTGCFPPYCYDVIIQLAVHCTSSLLHVQLLPVKVRYGHKPYGTGKFKIRIVGW